MAKKKKTHAEAIRDGDVSARPRKRNSRHPRERARAARLNGYDSLPNGTLDQYGNRFPTRSAAVLAYSTAAQDEKKKGSKRKRKGHQKKQPSAAPRRPILAHGSTPEERRAWLMENLPRDSVPPERRKFYLRYLNSKPWKRRARAAYEAAGWRCACCRANAPLHAHHKTYVRLGNEDPDDLVAVCQECHAQLHLIAQAMNGQKRAV